MNICASWWSCCACASSDRNAVRPSGWFLLLAPYTHCVDRWDSQGARLPAAAAAGTNSRWMAGRARGLQNIQQPVWRVLSHQATNWRRIASAVAVTSPWIIGRDLWVWPLTSRVERSVWSRVNSDGPWPGLNYYGQGTRWWWPPERLYWQPLLHRLLQLINLPCIHCGADSRDQCWDWCRPAA